jgi:hypothetical protein
MAAIIHEPGFDRVVQNIFDDPFQLGIVADEMVIAFVLPKSANTPKHSICQFRRIPFDIVCDFYQTEICRFRTFTRDKYKMNMVGHNAKSYNIEPFTIVIAD